MSLAARQLNRATLGRQMLAPGRSRQGRLTAPRPSQEASVSSSACTALVTVRLKRPSSWTACTCRTDRFLSAVVGFGVRRVMRSERRRGRATLRGRPGRR